MSEILKKTNDEMNKLSLEDLEISISELRDMEMGDREERHVGH